MEPADIDATLGSGRYQIVGHLATGGMAEVLLGKRLGPSGFERAVVIKRILPQLARQPSFVKMFLDEARIAAAIRHANVVDVHELGQEGEQLYLVMEYLEGEPAEGLLRRLASRGQHLDPFLCAHIAAEACAGLHAAHELTDADGRPQNLVHRDVSPHNIFLTYDGQVKVLDFGIVKVANRASMTEAGLRKGKWAYMSPEQVRGEPLDRRSDVFALGIVLFELSTSRRLFSKKDQDAALRAAREQAITPPSQVVPGYPAWLEAIVLRALSHRPADRFASAAEMRRQLLVAIHGAAPPGGHGDALGALMREVFADRLEEKREMLRRVRAGGRVGFVPLDDPTVPEEIPMVVDLEVPDASLESSAETPMSVEVPISSPLPPGPEQAGRGRGRWIMAAVFFAVAAVGAFWLATRGFPVSRSSRHTGAPVASEVTIHVATSPPGATVLLGGAAQGVTPLDLRLVRGAPPSPLVLRLAGYQERRELVAPEGRRQLRFELTRTVAPASP